MANQLGTSDDEGEDDAALIDAFFLPGGILDPEDDVDVGFKSSVSPEDAHTFSLHSVASPVSLNPWNTLHTTQADTEAHWIIDHAPHLQSRLLETLQSDSTSPRQQNYPLRGSLSANALPADTLVHPPEFLRSTSEHEGSGNTRFPLTEDTVTGNAASSVWQVKTSRSISFADVIRSSPSFTFDTPERKQQRHPGHTLTMEDGGKSYTTGKPVPRARSSSPLANRANQSTFTFPKVRTKKVSRHVDKPAQPMTEWNDVDRGSVGRAGAQPSSNEKILATQPRPNSMLPNLLFDSDDDTHEISDESPSKSLVHVPHDVDISTTSEPSRKAATESNTVDLSLPVFDAHHASSLDKEQVQIDKKVQDTTTVSFSEPSNSMKTNAQSKKDEIITLLAPSLNKLMVFLNYVTLFLWNLAQLIAVGGRNVLIYASWEVSLNDDTLACYLLLYTLPMICDRMMALFSLPHFLPHVISTMCLYYFLCRFPSQPSWTNSSRVSDEASILILNAFRCYLPLALILEGFREPNLMVMLLDKSSRLVLAYFLSMLRAGFLLSPVGWLGWSFQMILAFWLPDGFLSSCIISLSGLSLLRLLSTLPARKSA
jgi:hypothetical protein